MRRPLRLRRLFQDTSVRILLLHDTQHDLPAVESVLVANGYEVRSVAVDVITLQSEVDRWNPELILIAADNAARDVMEHICVCSQFRERPIVVFTEDRDPVAMRAAMQARVAAYVVAGLNPARVQPVIAVALARFKEDQVQAAQLANAQQSLQIERDGQRSIARAKAMLARRGLAEPEAYALLRATAMRERCTVADAAERMLSNIQPASAG
jgi:two-component system, response regulator / RNA-binding antiterminator